MSARDRILVAVRSALANREQADHPGAFGSWGLELATDALTTFTQRFEAAGGSVVRLATPAAARKWLEAFASDHDAAAVGAVVPAELRPRLATAPPETAPLGVSMGRRGVAETGSVLLDAVDGQRVQLLPPVHLIWLPASRVRATLAEALAELHAGSGGHPSAIGIHSGPSKSADIGQVLVQGVHGPGRVVVGLLDFDAS